MDKVPEEEKPGIYRIHCNNCGKYLQEKESKEEPLYKTG
jgi:hypothetical protein